MILVILFICLVIVFIGLTILFSVLDKHDYYHYNWDTVALIFLALSIFVGLGASISIGLSIGVNSVVNCKKQELHYEEQVKSLNDTYEVLIHVDETWDKYTAIQQYNQEVKDFKYEIKYEQEMLDNLWLNWFHCKSYKNFDSNSVSYI